MKITLVVTKEHISSCTPLNWSCRSCPVARALKDATGETWYVDYDWAQQDVIRDADRAIKLPKRVERFIRGFDAGKRVRPFSIELEV